MNSARGFASDNSATIHPDVLAAIARVNVGHAFGYGHDDYTLGVEARVAHTFGEHASAFFVFNGTGANVLSLRAACRRCEGVICAETAHLNVDECGAPEAIAGLKLLIAPGVDGKLTPEAVERRIARVGDEHAVQPRAVSISQCTELGTLYSLGGDAGARGAGARARSACCMSTGRVCRTRRRRSGVSLAEVAAAGRTCCRSAAPRTGCSAPRRSCC